MTNEEAINQLKDMQSRCTNGYDAEAINIAIKALETERPTGKECELIKRAFFNAVETANHIEKLKQEAENDGRM